MPQPRESKSEVLDAAKAQYSRRGRPIEKTGWGPSEIHRYMRYQFSEFKKGHLNKRKLGGWGWTLPKKDPETGEPASLPKEVLKYEESLKSKDGKRKAKEDSSSSDEKPKKSKKIKAEKTKYALELRYI